MTSSSSAASTSAPSWSGRALAALIVGAVGIAFAPIFVEFGVRTDGIGPSAAAFWRMTLAGLFFTAWVLVHPASRSERGSFSWTLLLPGLFFACDLAVWHWSFRFTNLANATLLANFATVVVVIAGWWLFKERFGGLFVLGAGIALAGTAVLLRAGFDADPTTLKGDALGLLTALFYGAYLVSIKLHRRVHSTLRLMVWSCWTAAPVLGVIAWAGDEVIWPTSTGGWMSMVGLAVVAHCIGQALIAYALAHLPAGFSAVTLLIQPLTVALLQWVLFSQQLTGGQLAGGAVVLVGIVLARLGAVAAAARQPAAPNGAS